MKYSLISTIVGLVVSALPLGTASACEYTVRDVGFVDLGADNYRLVIYHKATPRELATAKAAKAILDEVCKSSNVQPDLIGFSKMSPQDKLLTEQAKVEQFPAALLVSPDGKRGLVVATPNELLASRAQLRKQFEAVVTSPTKTNLLAKALSAYSVILLVESEDSRANEKARTLAAYAIDQVKNKLPLLPKQIDNPPHLMVLKADQAKRHEVLLWSLGLALTNKDHAQVAVVFGRGRRMERVYQVPGVTQKDFMVPFDILGKDCECSLPREVIRGTAMIPHRWTSKDEDHAAKVLKFDPKALEVTISVRTILEKRKTGAKSSAGGYKEFDLDDPLPQVAKGEVKKERGEPKSPKSSAGQKAANATTPEPKIKKSEGEPNSNGVPSKSSGKERVAPAKPFSPVMAVVWFVGGLVVFLSLLNLVLVFRKRRNNAN